MSGLKEYMAKWSNVIKKDEPEKNNSGQSFDAWDTFLTMLAYGGAFLVIGTGGYIVLRIIWKRRHEAIIFKRGMRAYEAEEARLAKMARRATEEEERMAKRFAKSRS